MSLELWSVTTLKSMGLGINPGLNYWGKERVASAAYDDIEILQAYHGKDDRDGAIEMLMKAPFKKSTKAAARGTAVHAAAEAYALGQTPEVEDHILPYVDQYRRFLDTYEPEFLMTEAPVYNPTRGYAGTCDGVLVLGGERLVYDIKTTEHSPDAKTRSGRPKSRPPHADIALQLVAYRRAELVGVLAEQRYSSGRRYYVFDPDAHHEPMPETDGAIAIVVSPYDVTVTPVKTGDDVWNAWLHTMAVARFQEFTSKHVFGPQIKPPRSILDPEVQAEMRDEFEGEEAA